MAPRRLFNLKLFNLYNFSFNLDCTWSEIGDRYMLKLFRDYLFHSITEDGRPWLDHAHIVQCLNKLDAGSLERVSRRKFNLFCIMLKTWQT